MDLYVRAITESAEPRFGWVCSPTSQRLAPWIGGVEL